ncbi:MAG: hypothetical protein KC464_04760, partial [Myxococcales bacterium]|nr:hypothetical protein [Myxococcales bacterium]
HQYPYWNTWVEADHMVYLQYNACVDAPGQPFADFAAATLAFADGHPVERFVIDLRFNGGGNSELIRPLLDGLIARPALARGLYVIIGRDTFSSAVLDAILLARAGAVLVGEPSGGRPSHHGEVQTFTLPRSHLRVSYSTKYFDNPDFPGDAIEPAIAVPQRAADWFAGRDPALDAIRAAAR